MDYDSDLPIPTPVDNTAGLYLAVEDLFVAQQQAATAFFGPRVAAQIWRAKDLDRDSEEFALIGRAITERIYQEIDSGRKVGLWIVAQEKDCVFDTEEILEDTAEDTPAPETTGHEELDNLLHQVMKNGAQLEELAGATRFKAQVDKLFELNDFEEVSGLQMFARTPFVDMVKALEKDLDSGVNLGLRHPKAFTLAVGAVMLQLGEGEGVQNIPLFRLQQCTQPRRMGKSLLDEARHFGELLTQANEVHQERLKQIPDDWPNPDSFDLSQDIANRRFKGDNGILSNDFYSGRWIKEKLATELHRPREELIELTGPAGIAQKLAQARGAIDDESPLARRRALRAQAAG